MLQRLFTKSSFSTKTLECHVSAKRLLQTLKTSNTEPKNIVRSVVPNISIPNIFLEDYIWKNLYKWENKTALICAETGRSYLYSQVYRKSRALSNFIRNKIPGLKGKHTVAIILPNTPEYPIILLGLIQAGHRVTTVNSSYKSDEIYRQLLNSETKFVFTNNHLWPEVKKAIQQLKINLPVAIIKETQDESIPDNTIDFNQIVEGNAKTSHQTERNVDDIIILPYSSGTTGLPKGVELTHRNIVTNLCQMACPLFKIVQESEGSFQEILTAILPMFHIYGMVAQLLNGLASGSKLVTMSKFHPETFVNVLEVHNPTVGYFVPPIVLFLSNSKVRPDHINQFRTIASGGAPLGAADIERVREKSKVNTNLIQLYGLTETAPLTHAQTLLVENGVEIGGTGLTIPNTECLIRAIGTKDENGLCSNTEGELCIRGPQVMKGYYKNPEATKDALDSNGWFGTGDIAYFNDNGHLFVTDRIKELIKVKGFQVAPAELEAILRNHPDIADAAVVGVRHVTQGEAPRAFIIPKTKNKVNISEIEAYVASKVAPFKRLTGGVVITDIIPKTLSGKILRRQLKEK